MAHEKPYTDKAMKDHASTYIGFKSMMRWSILVIAIVLIGLLAFVYY